MTQDTSKKFYNDLAKFQLLNEQEEKDLFIKAQNDKQARDLFINSNMRLVLAVAKKYKGRGIPFDDLVQEGGLGLVKAFESYDIEKGYKFSTLATYWVKQYIGRAIANKSRTMRIPVYLYEVIGKIKKAQGQAITTLGRNYTNKELAEMLDIPLKTINHAQAITETVSLETPVGKEEDGTLGELIADENKSAEIVCEEQELSENLQKAFEELKEKERFTLIHYFGLCNNKTMTFEQIGEKLGVTKQRVKQLQDSAFKKLRKNPQILSYLMA